MITKETKYLSHFHISLYGSQKLWKNVEKDKM